MSDIPKDIQGVIDNIADRLMPEDAQPFRHGATTIYRYMKDSVITRDRLIEAVGKLIKEDGVAMFSRDDLTEFLLKELGLEK